MVGRRLGNEREEVGNAPDYTAEGKTSFTSILHFTSASTDSRLKYTSKRIIEFPKVMNVNSYPLLVNVPVDLSARLLKFNLINYYIIRTFIINYLY